MSDLKETLRKANSLLAQDTAGEAQDLYYQVLIADPLNVEALMGLGLIWSCLGCHQDDAVVLLEQAYRQRPDVSNVITNYASVLINAGRLDEARPLIDKVLVLDPLDPVALNNKGIVNPPVSEDAVRQNIIWHTLAIKAAGMRNLNAATMYTARAVAFMDLRHWDKAAADLAQAAARDPGNWNIKYNRAICALAQGDYLNGFADYDARWFQPDTYDKADEALRRSVPQWNDEEIAGKRLLYYHEQGFGDAIMMVRYIPVLKALGADLTVMLPKPVQPLVDPMGVPHLTDEDDPAAFDYKCALFEVMRALKQRPEDVPNKPYLTADPVRIARFRPWVESHKRHMGLVWSGRPTHRHDRFRSLALVDLLSWLDHDGYVLHSLQLDHPEDAVAAGVRTYQFEDFADTAALMTLMDHIVTVESAPQCLAAAIGHPSTHVLAPYSNDWRFYRDAWFPTAKFYWQDSVGDWPSAFIHLNAALKPPMEQAA